MTNKIFHNYDHLGFFNPFYFINDAGEIILDKGYFLNNKKNLSPLSLDQLAIAEVLNKRFMLGDRTIIQNVFRTPWMTYFDEVSKHWSYKKITEHQNIIESEELIAQKLCKLICEEIKFYIGHSKNIGILLSGGMDSRIVAGAIDYLIKSHEIKVNCVTAYTWGNPNSRDVVYAKRVADRLNWKWKHYKVSSSNLWENLRIAGHRGCEYSGIHLHAIPQITNEIKDDVLLVGSYGDSIGRAEYEGVHLENLTPLSKTFRNFGFLIRHSSFSAIKHSWKEDIDHYHMRYPLMKSYQKNELDYQVHYMRRMLNPCFELVNEVVPTYQVFTSPPVYNYMWSLDPSCRNNNIYSKMMNLFSSELHEIPWARTGLPYGIKQGQKDHFSKKHTDYSHLIQSELIDKIETRILSRRITSLNFLNTEAIKSLVSLIRRFPDHNFDYLERITWLVSLDFFLEKYIDTSIEINNTSLIDNFSARVLSPVEYFLLHCYRRIKG